MEKRDYGRWTKCGQNAKKQLTAKDIYDIVEQRDKILGLFFMLKISRQV